YNREDMWDGQWDFGPSDFDNFDLAHPLLRYLQDLTAVRRRHEALRRGETIVRFAQSGAPGLLVFGRRTANGTVVVAVNTSNAPDTRSVTSSWPEGIALFDALDPTFVEPVQAGGTVTLRMPARGARLYESQTARGGLTALEKLRIEASYPGHDLSV